MKRPLLERNPYITEILNYGEDALVQLDARTFDRVINLDASKTSAALASIHAVSPVSGIPRVGNPSTRSFLLRHATGAQIYDR